MKRAFDVVVSGTLLVLLMPFMLLIGLAVYWQMGSPILFRQMRPGLNGQPFELIKFRTMLHAADDADDTSDAVRVTSFGRVLRASSLDELPELWNVLKGDMSLVGPRPLLIEYLPLYTVEEFRRHEVRPGVTGWAQVNGRNAIGWEEKFALDVWYVDNLSLMLDLKILWRTLVAVFARHGINDEGGVGQARFDQSDRRPK